MCFRPGSSGTYVNERCSGDRITGSSKSWPVIVCDSTGSSRTHVIRYGAPVRPSWKPIAEIGLTQSAPTAETEHKISTAAAMTDRGLLKKSSSMDGWTFGRRASSHAGRRKRKSYLRLGPPARVLQSAPHVPNDDDHCLRRP